MGTSKIIRFPRTAEGQFLIASSTFTSPASVYASTRTSETSLVPIRVQRIFRDIRAVLAVEQERDIR